MLGCPITTYALACEHADAHAVIVPLCSLTKGALRRKYTLNLKMFFLLIRESTILCSQYLVSVTLNYDIRAFNVCRLEERELLSACLASCVLLFYLHLLFINATISSFTSNILSSFSISLIDIHLYLFPLRTKIPSSIFGETTSNDTPYNL